MHSVYTFYLLFCNIFFSFEWLLFNLNERIIKWERKHVNEISSPKMIICIGWRGFLSIQLINLCGIGNLLTETKTITSCYLIWRTAAV